VLSMDPDIDATSRHCWAPRRRGAVGHSFSGPIVPPASAGRTAAICSTRRPAISPSRSCIWWLAGTEHAVLMVESEAKGLSEEVMLGAVVFGHEQMQVAIRAIKELAARRASRAGAAGAGGEPGADERGPRCMRRPPSPRPTASRRSSSATCA